VVVIGGGNAAIDSARTALRMGADVTVIYRRERKDMPAIPEETEAAEPRARSSCSSPRRTASWATATGAVKAIEVVKTTLGEFDTLGPPPPVPTDEIVRASTATPSSSRSARTVDLDFARPRA
jgi:NADPH-dependent glutamate synthase beta subunit-like oxidoreductase